ncbi:hypothetical protein QCA50_015224 [Cerrena zonata]|uniref:Cytochrome P450 n=1 Tax=Cerrena zonata TaxID=2478898 RepID=A0AAW0FSM4_9APHY
MLSTDGSSLAAMFSFTLALLALWAISRVFRRIFSHSTLDNIPGPPSQSFIKGNIARLFDRYGWDFMDELGERYGSVVKLTGPIGRKILFVFDPKALQHVVLKDQDTYEQSGFTAESFHAVIGSTLLSTTGSLSIHL